MKKYLIESPQESDRLNYQNKIDVYNLDAEIERIRPNPTHLFLDAGCGNGNVIEALMNKGIHTVHGVDLGTQRVVEAQKRFQTHPGIKIFHCSLENTGFEDNFYDDIICRYIFEHVTNPKEILTEMFRVLKSKGTLHVINFDDIFFNFHTKNEKFNQQLKNLKNKLPQDFEIGRKLPLYLAACGFEAIDWEAETFFFKDERMALEIENSRMRLDQGREHLSKYFPSQRSYDKFAQNYLEEMKDPLNVMATTKFQIRAAKPSGKLLPFKV